MDLVGFVGGSVEGLGVEIVQFSSVSLSHLGFCVGNVVFIVDSVALGVGSVVFLVGRVGRVVGRVVFSVFLVGNVVFGIAVQLTSVELSQIGFAGVGVVFVGWVGKVVFIGGSDVGNVVFTLCLSGG